MNQTPVIDSHQHFWDRSRTEFDYSWQESDELKKICRTFLPADLQPNLDSANVDGSIFVQTQHNVRENHWALELYDESESLLGVVGWVDLKSPECRSQLMDVIEHPGFVGVRHVTQDEPDEDFIVSDPVAKGLGILQEHDVPFDLLFYAQHIKHAKTVASRFPNQRFVIDHMSKPRIKSGEIDEWEKELFLAAQHENVFCKLSGLVTEADWQSWSIDDLRPYFDVALEAFGPNRLMFGSDWPVCLLAASYEQVVSAAKKLIAELSEYEQSAILGGNAIRFYRLQLP